MAMNRDFLALHEQFLKRQDEFEKGREIFLAWIGDGSGEDPRLEDNPNYIYVRNLDRGVFPAVLNLDMAPRNNLPVWVGVTPQDDDVFEVLGLASEYMTRLGNQSYMGWHHEAHEFRNADGGDDVVWHQKQQGVYLLGAPTDPASMRVFVHRDFYLYMDHFKWWGGGLTPDLSAYMPSGAYARYVLITIDGEDNTIDVKVGAQFPTYPPPPIEDAMPTLDMHHIPVTAVYLVGGMSSITWDNLFDVRLLAGGGYGAWEAIGMGDPYELMHMNAAGTALEWRPFQWLYAGYAAGSNLVHTHDDAAQGGSALGFIDELSVSEHVEIVDAGGVIAGVGNYVVVITDDPAESRDLHTISGNVGVFMYLFGHYSLHAGRTVTVKHGIGNLELLEDQDFVLDGPNKGMLMFYREDSLDWVEFARTEELFGSGSYPAHNSLPGLQGGAAGEYYHLPSGTYAALVDPNAQLTALHTDGHPTFDGLHTTDYVDWDEIAKPANPPADTGRMYAKDVGGVTVPFWLDPVGTETSMIGAGGGGDVVGPAGATDNAIARYDGVTGKLIQDSAVLVDDSGHVDPVANGQDLGDLTHRWDLYTEEVYFGGATGTNFIQMPDDDVCALRLVDAGGTEYYRFISTDAQPQIRVNYGNADIDYVVGSQVYPIAVMVRGVDGYVGLGAEPGNVHLDVYDAALEETDTFYGIRSRHQKTAGITNTGDHFYGVYSHMQLNQSGGIIGSLVGMYYLAELDLGTVGSSLVGAMGYARQDGGWVVGNIIGVQAPALLYGGDVGNDVHAILAYVDVDSGYTSIGGDVFGIKVDVDVDIVVTGTVYVAYFGEGDGVDYGIYQSGTAPNYFGGNVGIGEQSPSPGGVYGLHITSTQPNVGIELEAGSTGDAFIMLDENGTDEVKFGWDASSNAFKINLTSTSFTPNDFSINEQAMIGMGVGPVPSIHLYVADFTLDTTSTYFGIRSYHEKTGGANDPAADYYGIQSYMSLNQSGASIDNLFGLYTYAKVADGTGEMIVGVYGHAQMVGGVVSGSGIRGTQGTADIDAGTITGDITGLYSFVDVEAAVTSITGNVHGLCIAMDVDTDPSGQVNLICLTAGGSNIDYAIYSENVSPSYFAGDVGVGSSAPGVDIGGGTYDTTGNTFEVQDTSAEASIVVDGDVAALYLADRGGAANDKLIKLTVDDGIATWSSRNDDGTVRKTSLISYDLGGGYVGIGEPAAGGYHLKVQNAALAWGSSWRGIYSYHVKTSAGSGGTYRSVSGLMVFSDSDQSCDYVYGADFIGRLAAGTIDSDLYGISVLADADAGTITGNVYGAFVDVDLEATMTYLGVDVYGAYIRVDADEDPDSGDVYMLFLEELSNVDFGIFQSGSGQNVFGGLVNANASGIRTITVADNVSNPPTDAELDTAFGTPATVGDGFVGLVDDNGAGTTVWACVALNSKWWYVEMTEAT